MKEPQFLVFVVSALGGCFALRASGAAAFAARRFRGMPACSKFALVAALTAAVALGGGKGGRGSSGIFLPESRTASPVAERGRIREDAAEESAPQASLRFSAISLSPGEVLFAAAWPDGETLPDSVLDVFSAPSLDGHWSLAATVPAVASPAAFALAADTNAPAAFFRLGTRLDSDSDGLSDACELLVHQTDPRERDSDFDGVPDGDEAAIGTNPLADDTDGDGRSDLETLLCATDPFAPGELPPPATIRHFRDSDSALTASFPGPSPAMSRTAWTQVGNAAEIHVQSRSRP